MITWLIASVAISCTGALAYHWVHRRIRSLWMRKSLVYGILILSLVLPVFYIYSPAHHTHHYSFKTSGEFIPTTPTTVEEFCNCQDPGKSEVVQFQANRLYDFILANMFWFYVAFGAVALSILLINWYRTGALLRITRRLHRFRTEIDGLKVRLLKTEAFPTGSFRLFGKYVLWNSALDTLNEAEKSAVLVHEASHLRQFNTHEILILQVLQSIWFMNPALYYFRKELEGISEFIADEAASNHMGSRKAYASLLLKLKSCTAPVPIRAFRGSSLRDRIQRLVGGEPQDRLKRSTASSLIAVMLFSMLAVNYISCTCVEQQTNELKMYEVMVKEHQLSGKQNFCKTCTLEEACY